MPSAQTATVAHGHVLARNAQRELFPFGDTGSSSPHQSQTATDAALPMPTTCASVELMDIHLTQDQKAFVQSVLASGQFQRPDEVVAAALQLFREARDRKNQEELDAFYAELRQRLKDAMVPAESVYTRLFDTIDAAPNP